MVEGHNWRREREHELAAWVVSYLLQPHTKRRLTVDLLLGRASKKHVSSEEAQRALQELREEFD